MDIAQVVAASGDSIARGKRCQATAARDGMVVQARRTLTGTQMNVDGGRLRRGAERERGRAE